MKYPESSKLWSDYLKHLTSLSTGSIILISAFLEKLFKQPEWKVAVVISLSGFLICVFGSVISYTSVAICHIFWETDEQPPYWVQLVGVIALLVSWLAFCVGIASLTFFAIKNIM